MGDMSKIAGKMSKIVATDNFGMSGENPGKDERFLLWPMPEEDAKAIVTILNNRVDVHGPDYFKVVPTDYKLEVFQP